MEETGVNLVDFITEAGTTLAAGVNVVWDLMTANPWLTLMIGVSLVSMGFGFFRRAKRAAH